MGERWPAVDVAVMTRRGWQRNMSTLVIACRAEHLAVALDLKLTDTLRPQDRSMPAPLTVTDTPMLTDTPALIGLPTSTGSRLSADLRVQGGSLRC